MKLKLNRIRYHKTFFFTCDFMKHYKLFNLVIILYTLLIASCSLESKKISQNSPAYTSSFSETVTDDTVFFGVYYDRNMSTQQLMWKHLLHSKEGMDPDGHFEGGKVMLIQVCQSELCRQMQSEKMFNNCINKNLGNKRCNFIAFHIFRAYHAYEKMELPSGTQHTTIVTIGVAAYVFSPYAAESKIGRFETVFSSAKIGYEKFDSKLTGIELDARYERVFSVALQLATESLEVKGYWNRKRANGVFQVTDFLFPKASIPELEYMVKNQLYYENKTGSSAKTVEDIKKRLMEEFKLLLHTFIVDALKISGITNIALLPPETSWMNRHIIRALHNKFDDRPFTDTVHKQSLKNMGFTIRGKLAKIDDERTDRYDEKLGLEYRLTTAYSIGRLYQATSDKYIKGMHVPKKIQDIAVKTSAGSGSILYLHDKKGEYSIDHARDIYRAITLSVEDMAPKLLPLMIRATNEY